MPVDPTTGKMYLVQVELTAGSGIYTTVAAQRGGTVNMEADAIDVSSKDDDGWSNDLPGKKNWGFEFDTLIIYDDSHYTQLLSWFKNGTKFNAQFLRSDDGKVFRGAVSLTSFPHSLPHDDAATVSATFSGRGAPAKIWETP